MERVFYTSENGDQWFLEDEDEVVTVRHRPNAASGGRTSVMDLGAFLVQEQHSPQNQALRRLLSTLVDNRPAETAPFL